MTTGVKYPIIRNIFIGGLNIFSLNAYLYLFFDYFCKSFLADSSISIHKAHKSR